VEERFWEKVNKDGPLPPDRPDLGPCWLWTRGKNGEGYGTFRIGDSARSAHLVAYEWEYGPIPEGLQADHLCRVHACVRPSHLEAVTQQLNILRGVGLAAKQARQTHCMRGHPFDEINTGRTKRGQRYCKQCQRLKHQARREARR
jgi:hypothetical protein